MFRSDGRGRRARAVDAAAAAVAAVLLAVSLFGFAAGIGAGTTATGDRSAAIAPSSYAVEADPGEEFELEVLLHSDGGHGGEGVASVALIAQYHPDYLEITDVERGPWLEQGPATDVRVERALAHDRGTAVLEQRRDPAAGGATGNAVLATITVAVAEDAPPSEATIGFEESRVELVRQFPLPVYAQEATVEIDGGGAPVPSYEHPDPATIETAPPPADDGDGDGGDGTDAGSTTGGDESGGEGTDGDERRDGERRDDEADDPVPGLAVPVAATVVIATALVLQRRYR